MSENLKNLLPAAEIAETMLGQSAVADLSVAAAARRKMLLTSLGRGSAVVAAASLPLKALAAIPAVTLLNLGPQVRCTISGMQSGVHSKETIRETCAGRKPSSYGPPTTALNTPWPGNLDKGTPFSLVFTNSSETRTLIQIIQSDPTTDNAYWIAAFLNSLSSLPVSNFPYTPTEVQGLFNTNPGPALIFFKTYLSTL